MTEIAGKVTFQGNPLTLIGKKIEIGDKLPDTTLIGNDLSPVKITAHKGIKIIATIPSLDTPVCDTEIRRFNTEASKMENVTIFAVSADLPFAQARWCGAANIDRVISLSDHKEMAFASATGLHIRELRLFARAILVVDSDNKIVYKDLVSEVTDEPNYASALEATKKAQ